MHDQRLVTFKIDSMDSLGQGVSKETDKITFIAKTLPGETGDAYILSSKKGVQFAHLNNLITASPKRETPACVHFLECPSCHFLHTSYAEELKFKLQNLERLFKKIPHPAIEVTPAVRRSHYRNRLQLHYDLKARKLGMLDAKNHKIAPIPQCLIANDKVGKELTRLYQANAWLELVSKNQPASGHLEIYEFEDEIKVAVNRPYADGGFTQVFDEMNQLMKEKLHGWFQKFPSSVLLELFAGNGHLSENLNYSKRLCVDFYPQKKTDPFFSQDLYSADAMIKVTAKLKELKLKPNQLVLDPPRSGLKNLEAWLEELKPLQLAYISCDPHTLVRDLMPLKNYQIRELHLVDFFPSTFHFETVAFLERL